MFASPIICVSVGSHVWMRGHMCKCEINYMCRCEITCVTCKCVGLHVSMSDHMCAYEITIGEGLPLPLLPLIFPH